MKTNRREHHQLGCVVSAASIHGSVGILPGPYGTLVASVRTAALPPLAVARPFPF